MSIYAPTASKTKVSTFVRTCESQKSGHVTCFPIYGGFQMNIPEEEFSKRFKEVSDEHYAALLKKYKPISVCFDTAVSPDQVIEGYTNGKLWNGWETPVFTKEQIQAGMADSGVLAPNGYSQIIWHDESGSFIVASSGEGTLPEHFDVSPYVDRLLEDKDGYIYEENADLEVSLCRPFDISVKGETLRVYDINTQGWCWENAAGMVWDSDNDLPSGELRP